MKAALVTGGAKRIGKEICLGLASMGYDIALHFSATDPADAVSLIKEKGVRCIPFKCDFSDERAVLGLMDNVKDAFPGLEVLVNNASIFERSTIRDTDTGFFDRHFAVNFKAPYFLTRDFCKATENGHIINIIDSKVRKNSSPYSAYLLSKKTLRDFTFMAAKEFAPDIRVNAVAPGLILPPPGKDDSYLKGLAGALPLKRTGSPGDVFNAVRFLIENSFITGQIIYIDGGENL
ncbi:MAG: SDR family oxidoreductase [Thermodesulfobacteriota bacterium]|nr:MAG: SDR family oxidoreductase [Thermodesulfobacteriota bacterium]